MSVTDPADRLSAAIDGLVTRFAAMVRSVGLRHGLSDGDLAEVMQDVRIRLWHAGRRGERIEGVSTSYVYRAAMSAALDLLRRRRTLIADSLEGGDTLAAGIPAAERDPEAAMVGNELAQRILAAVEALHPPRRAAVRLYLSGYEAAEITRVMDWTEGKTRNLLSRGLADLRERLRREGITEHGER